MGFTIIPTGGPMWNEPLSEMRTKALIAIDSGPLSIPAEVTEYIIALELRYHEMKSDRNRDFLRSTWEARGCPAENSAGVSRMTRQGSFPPDTPLKPPIGGPVQGAGDVGPS